LTKALAARFVGTFALIFLGAGAATALGGGQLPPSGARGTRFGSAG
jgi:glycerol uptake facilitator-like aquaporin